MAHRHTPGAEERVFAVRYRIDGVLHLRMTQRANASIGRIAHQTHFRHGHSRTTPAARRPDFHPCQRHGNGYRVSCVPGVNGESIVMRLLPKERTISTSTP